jgi:hypothetical protein
MDRSKVEREFQDWILTGDGNRVMREAIMRATKLRLAGYRRYGLKAIIESIRYDSSVSLLGDSTYRINDHHTSFLARRIMEDQPSLRGFFGTRALRGRV